jgi:hypothetical protein
LIPIVRKTFHSSISRLSANLCSARLFDVISQKFFRIGGTPPLRPNDPVWPRWPFITVLI